jgi:hypothetical protein
MLQDERVHFRVLTIRDLLFLYKIIDEQSLGRNVKYATVKGNILAEFGGISSK